jgi:hypothetical protein
MLECIDRWSLLYKQEAKRGDPGSMFVLAQCYMTGYGLIKRDYYNARYWLTQAKRAGFTPVEEVDQLHKIASERYRKEQAERERVKKEKLQQEKLQQQLQQQQQQQQVDEAA